MRSVVPLFALAILGAGPSLQAWEAVQQHSVSRSHQFVVYSDDANARARVAMYADDAKEKLLQFLQLKDEWKRPIVIQLSPADAADPGRPASDVRILDTEEGFKVTIDVVLGPDMRQARFPQQLVRAILLEYVYRDQPDLVGAGATYAEPPPWIIEGLANLAADPDPATGSDLFRSLIAAGKNPSLSQFLSEQAADLDTPSRQVYAGCATSLVRLLTELPGGRLGLQNFIRHWPGPEADPEAELVKAFPDLNTGGDGLEKWWALGLARLSAADRYEGLTLADTNRELDAMLKFEVTTSKSGAKEEFTLAQYPLFRKKPGARAALSLLTERLVGLEANANPLMREVVNAYESLAAELARGKSAHLTQRLAAAEEYRRRLIGRMDEIADYLNWFQVNEQKDESGAFEEYIRTAESRDSAGSSRHDPISDYLDGFEKQLSE